MEIKRVPISQVEPWDKNPRNIKTKDFERLKKQILELGIYKPLICYKEGDKYITLGGNMRLLALRELGIPEVEISIVHPKSEAEKIKYNLSDNDRAGEYDDQALAELIYPHQDEIQLEDFKVDLGEAIDLKGVIDSFGPELEDFEEEEIPEIDDGPAVTQPGDLYQLGRHRLLCGDATKEEDVKRLMNGQRADMVFTDPPYGINLDTDFSGMKEGKKYKEIIGDNRAYDPAHIFHFFSYCKEIFLWGADYYAEKIPNRNSGSWFVWDKMGGGQGCNDDYEKMFGSNFELCWSKNKHKRALVRILWKGIFGLSKEDTKSRVHPTQKPTELVQWFLERFSQENQYIWDGFLGSGSTLIACEKLNRICYGMEIDPHYCDVIIKRYSNFTGIPEEEIRATRETS